MQSFHANQILVAQMLNAYQLDKGNANVFLDTLGILTTSVDQSALLTMTAAITRLAGMKNALIHALALAVSKLSARWLSINLYVRAIPVILEIHIVDAQ